MITPIVLPSQIAVYSERPEIIDFFKSSKFSGTEIACFRNFSFQEDSEKMVDDNSIFIDPKVYGVEFSHLDSLNEEHFPEKKHLNKIHFIMPQEEILAFLKLTNLPENAVIPIPCDVSVFKQKHKKYVKLFHADRKLEEKIDLLAEIAGTSDDMKLLKSKLILASESELPVLLLGESGTGKSYAASFIHKLSVRCKKTFNVLDIGTVSENIADTELFGSSYGAFTGAVNSKGLLLESNGGTLFIDEIGNASFSIQTKLLRFVETGKIRAVGSTTERQVNTRLIFATNANLGSMVKERLFRADFYNRINVFTIEFEPLRNHIEDVRSITESVLAKKDFNITQSALAALEDYDWPGNIRELKNCLDRAMVYCKNRCIDACDIILT